MSRYERHGTRSLAYSKWHRYYLGHCEPMIDVDAVEYCPERGCNRPLVLIETAVDVGQSHKSVTVLRTLAELAGVTALCVLYRLADGVDRASGCACVPSAADPLCPHGIDRFRVRRVWPAPTSADWRVMTPREFAERLRLIRRDHEEQHHRTRGVA